ncbi:MAG: hypothetical protein HUU02_09460 [Bacteroidetes bacterium]|nr:hypothetical protein [Bacteroidota bacterium]
MKKNPLLTFFSIILLLAGCTENDPASPAPTRGTMTLASSYSASVLAKYGSASGVDSIRITRARFLMKDVKFKNVLEDTLNFKSGAFILDLNLAGTEQTVAVADVPFGSYKRIEFDVHRIEPSTIAGRTDTAQFAEFLAGERYSVIINGTVKIDGKDTAFTYRSKVDAKQKIDIAPPLTVSTDSVAVKTLLRISSANWFRNGAGVLLDPNDKKNEGVIDENIKVSIKLKR